MQRDAASTTRFAACETAQDTRFERTDQSPHGGRTGAAGPADRTAASPHLRIAAHYLIAGAGCALFAFIYAQFSHGVYSPFMTYLFAIPLLGGALVALGLHAFKARPLPRTCRQAWALMLASLCLASCLRGIFEIAGTSSPLLIVYLAAAVVFAAIALVALVRNGRR